MEILDASWILGTLAITYLIFMWKLVDLNGRYFSFKCPSFCFSLDKKGGDFALCLFLGQKK